MSRNDQAVTKAEWLVYSLLLHPDLDPSKGGKKFRESDEPPLTSDDGQDAYQKAKDWGYKAKDWGSQTKDWVFENPGQATCYAVGAGSLVVLASPALFSSPVLTAVGFGNKGVIAKSIAAGLQSGIGNVVTPSYFATFTSAQMGGYGVAIVNGVVQVGAGAAAVASGGCITIRGYKDRPGN